MKFKCLVLRLKKKYMYSEEFLHVIYPFCKIKDFQSKSWDNVM